MAQPADLRVQMRGLVKLAASSPYFEVSAFCRALLSLRQEPHFLNMNHQLRERFVVLVSELVSLACLFSVPVFEAILPTGPWPEPWLTFKRVLASIQSEAVGWLQEQVPKLLRTSPSLYCHVIRKVFYLLPSEVFFGVTEEQLKEKDRYQLDSVRFTAVVEEDTLTRILIMGITDFPLSPPDALMVAHELVPKAAALHLRGVAALTVENTRLIDAVMKLTAYQTSIKLPDGYMPPAFAVKQQYWQAWQVLAVLVACNPATLGKSIWPEYPTLRILLRMAITGSFVQDLDRLAAQKLSVTPSGERQLATLEAEQILQLETHLAQAIEEKPPTAGTSKLLHHLILMQPKEVARAIPRPILDEFARTSQELSLGLALCRSRDPDFVLEVMSQDGMAASMRWLTPMLDTIPDAITHLPVTVLCELFIARLVSVPLSQDSGLTDRLCVLLRESLGQSSDVLKLLLKGLAAVAASDRRQAELGLQRLLHPQVGTPGAWLLESIPTLPSFAGLRAHICAALVAALAVVTQTSLAQVYIHFLRQYTQPNAEAETVGALARVLRQRPLLRHSLLRCPTTCTALAHFLGDSLVQGSELFSATVATKVTLQMAQGPAAVVKQDCLVGLLLIAAAAGPATWNQCPFLASILVPNLNVVAPLITARGTQLEVLYSGRQALLPVLQLISPSDACFALCQPTLPLVAVEFLLQRLDEMVRLQRQELAHVLALPDQQAVFGRASLRRVLRHALTVYSCQVGGAGAIFTDFLQSIEDVASDDGMAMDVQVNLDEPTVPTALALISPGSLLDSLTHLLQPNTHEQGWAALAELQRHLYQSDAQAKTVVVVELTQQLRSASSAAMLLRRAEQSAALLSQLRDCPAVEQLWQILVKVHDFPAGCAREPQAAAHWLGQLVQARYDAWRGTSAVPTGAEEQAVAVDASLRELMDRQSMLLAPTLRHSMQQLVLRRRDGAAARSILVSLLEHATSNKLSAVGLVVDWLSLLDPGLTALPPAARQKALSQLRATQPLREMMQQHLPWSLLRLEVTALVEPATPVAPETTTWLLDMVQGCMSHTSLLPAKETPFLRFTMQEVLGLVGLVLQEWRAAHERLPEDTAHALLRTRLELVVMACRRTHRTLAELVHGIHRLDPSNVLLVELYLVMPQVATILPAVSVSPLCLTAKVGGL